MLTSILGLAGLRSPVSVAALQVDRECSASEISRQQLSVRGGDLYVEPQAFVAGAGNVLLAGRPSYLWRTDGAGGTVQVADSLFGAILTEDGSGQGIPVPAGPRWIDDVRAVALEGGGWAILFTEPPTSAWPPDPAVQVWFGVFDGNHWSSLERLPVPPAWRIDGDIASDLVADGHTFAWAARAEVRSAEADESRVVLFERREGTWRMELWPFAPFYVDLDRAEAGDLVATVVRPDTSLPPPSYDRNSLFLYRPSDARPELQRIVRGGREAAHGPELRLGEAAALSWISEMDSQGLQFTPDPALPGAPKRGDELRAILNPLEAPPHDVITLDSGVLHAVYAPSLAGKRRWLTRHVDPSGKEMELRVIELRGETTHLLGGFPYPFDGHFAAVSVGRHEILVAGPQLDRTSNVLVTLLLRLRVEC